MHHGPHDLVVGSASIHFINSSTQESTQEKRKPNVLSKHKRDMLLTRRLGRLTQHHTPRRTVLCVPVTPDHVLQVDILHEHFFHVQKHLGHNFASKNAILIKSNCMRRIHTPG